MLARPFISIRECDDAEVSYPKTSAVASLVLLGGVLRPTLFHAAIGRSVLDLPVAPRLSVLQLWAEHVTPLARALGNPNLTVRLLLNSAAPRPRSAWKDGPIPLQIEEDPSEFRGSGGILRDLAHEYDDHTRLLVANAAQILLKSAQHLGTALVRSAADVALLAHQDGTPGSMMLARCGSLHAIPSLGFIDMKEQALPMIARQHNVKVMLQMRPTGLPLLSGTGYLEALRRYYLSLGTRSAEPNAFAEDWHSSFSIIEAGAAVERGARVHNSVVLSGGMVGRNAVLARSIVCPGGYVAAGQTVVDQLITSAKGQGT